VALQLTKPRAHHAVLLLGASARLGLTARALGAELRS
jgi:hypothetical protein